MSGILRKSNNKIYSGSINLVLFIRIKMPRSRRSDSNMGRSTRRNYTLTASRARALEQRQLAPSRRITRQATLQETENLRRGTEENNILIGQPAPPPSKIKWRNLEKSAFRYNKETNYKEKTFLGGMSVICEYCNAIKFKFESLGMCCRSGQVNLPIIPVPPQPLKGLLDYSHPYANQFHSNIHKYNTASFR